MLQLLGQTLRQLLAEKLGLKVCQAACPVFCLSDCTVMLSPSLIDCLSTDVRYIPVLFVATELPACSPDTAQLPVRAVDCSSQLPLSSLSLSPFLLVHSAYYYLRRCCCHFNVASSLPLCFFFVALSILAPHEKCELFTTFCAELAI